MLNRLFLLCMGIMLLTIGKAQLYPFTIFNTSNGLTNNRCGNISQDSAGYIWVGTDNGICNYDGRQFKFFPGYFTTYYFAHSQPNMYRGSCLLGASGGGLAKCAGNKLSFIVPSEKNNGQVMGGLAINDSSYLIARVYGIDKLLLIKGKEEIPIAVPEAINKQKMGFLLLLQDVEQNIWVGSNAGVVVFLKGNFNNPYVLPFVADQYTNCIKEDFEHNIFISSAGAVYKVDREQLKNVKEAKPRLFFKSNEHIPSMGFLRNGHVLLAQMTAGVKVFSKDLHWIKDINGSNGLNNTVWDIFTDRENNTWFATDNGLLRLKALDFIYFKSPQDIYTNIISGNFYDNSFVYSNGANVVKLVNDKEYLLSPANAKDLHERMLITHNGELWANSFSYAAVSNLIHATYQYVIENNNLVKKRNIQASYRLNSPVNIRQSVNFSALYTVFLTEDGKLFIYNGKKIQPITTAFNIMPTEFSLIAKGFNENDIWLVNNKKGLYHCTLSLQDKGVSLDLLQAIPLPKEILPVCKNLFCTKDGALWLGTSSKGILIYQKDKQQQYAYAKQITTPEVSSVMITALLQDSTGNMWVGTNNGIDKLTFTNDSSFTISKGMFDNSLSGRMIYFLKENNNRLYIGTTGSLGVAKINSERIPVAPLVNVNHLSVNNISADSLLSTNNFVFEPDENNISFEFVALSFINEKQTLYQYKLDGADTAWSNPSSNYTVTYARLKPGNYTFRVRAKNADNTWSEQDAVFSFRIKMPFYNHWAFYLLCAGICCGFIYWLYRQKIATLMAVEKTRQHISKDLHDDIGSTLSSITLMNAVLKNKIEKKPDEAAKLAEKIEDTSRQMIQNMSDIVWSINPGNDTMDKLQNRLQQFCADVFEDTDTLHKLTFSDGLLKKELPMQLRRDVYLICKEITNNAAKYSNAKTYTLMLSVDKRNICIQAVDDGIGFDSAVANSGNGLNNIRQRVAVNSGEALLYTEQGTRWSIKIPVK